MPEFTCPHCGKGGGMGRSLPPRFSAPAHTAAMGRPVKRSGYDWTRHSA